MTYFRIDEICSLSFISTRAGASVVPGDAAAVVASEGARVSPAVATAAFSALTLRACSFHSVSQSGTFAVLGSSAKNSFVTCYQLLLAVDSY